MKLMAEVCCIHTAIAIHSANCIFEDVDLKPIIDGFLELLRKYMFSTLEKHMPKFSYLYEERMTEYYKVLSENDHDIALSFAFLYNLHGNVKLDMESQAILAVRFSKAVSTGMKIMRNMAAG